MTHAKATTSFDYGHVLAETWPILLFLGFFFVMCTLPLVFAPEVAIYAFWISLGFVLTFAAFLLWYRVMGLLLFAMVMAAFTAVPDAWRECSSIGIGLMSFTLLGLLFIPDRRRQSAH